MIRRPPRSTRTDTLFPYTTLFRSLATDLGHDVPPQATRVEAAMTLGDRVPTGSGLTMANRVDSHVFGVPEPTDVEVEAVWTAVDGLRGEFHERASMWQRLRARFSLRSLVAGSRARPREPAARRQVLQQARTEEGRVGRKCVITVRTT